MYLSFFVFLRGRLSEHQFMVSVIEALAKTDMPRKHAIASMHAAIKTQNFSSISPLA
jgi:hypothetical protein